VFFATKSQTMKQAYEAGGGLHDQVPYTGGSLAGWGYMCSGTGTGSHVSSAKWGFAEQCHTYPVAPTYGGMQGAWQNGGWATTQISQCRAMGCDDWSVPGTCIGASTMAVQRDSVGNTVLYVAQGGSSVFSVSCTGRQRMRGLSETTASGTTQVYHGSGTQGSSGVMKCGNGVETKLNSYGATTAWDQRTGIRAVGYMAFSNNQLFITDRAGQGVYKLANPSSAGTMGAPAMIISGLPQVNGIYAFYASPATSATPAGAATALLVAAVALIMG